MGKVSTTNKKEAKLENKIYLDKRFYAYLGEIALPKIFRCFYCQNELKTTTQYPLLSKNKYCSQWCKEQDEKNKYGVCTRCGDRTSEIILKKERRRRTGVFNNLCFKCSPKGRAENLENKTKEEILQAEIDYLLKDLGESTGYIKKLHEKENKQPEA